MCYVVLLSRRAGRGVYEAFHSYDSVFLGVFWVCLGFLGFFGVSGFIYFLTPKKTAEALRKIRFTSFYDRGCQKYHLKCVGK